MGATRKPQVRAAEALLLGVAIALACGIAFIWVAHHVAEGEFDALDQRVLFWIQAHRTPGLTRFFTGITNLGSVTVIAPLTVGCVVALWLADRPGMSVSLGAAMLGSATIETLLKILVHRPRPERALWLTVPSGYAFPSGHTTASLVFFLTVALLVAGHVQRRGLRFFLVAYALLLGGLVACSRMYLGVHYPSDVIGGTLVGAAWSVSVVVAEHMWRHRGSRFVPA